MRLDNFDTSLCEWYRVDNAITLQNRIVPRVFDEYTLNGEPVDVLLVSSDVDSTTNVKIALIYKEEYLPVYDDGWFFLSKSRIYVTKKNNSDNSVFIGILPEPMS